MSMGWCGLSCVLGEGNCKLHVHVYALNSLERNIAHGKVFTVLHTKLSCTSADTITEKCSGQILLTLFFPGVGVPPELETSDVFYWQLNLLFFTHIGESSMLHLLSFLPVPRKKHLLFFSCKGNKKANLEQDGRNKEICKYNIIEVAVYIYICNIYK